MSQGFFSDAAKKLAQANGLDESNIYTHRDDGLATVDNVKCAILKRHKEGFLVQIQLGFTGINPTKTNMELLKRWYKKRAESAKYVVNVSDIQVLIVPARLANPYPPLPKHPPMTLQIDYRLHDNRRSEIEFSHEFLADPDDDGNYPIYVKDGKITSINVGSPNGGNAKLVTGRVINHRAMPLNNANGFGRSCSSKEKMTTRRSKFGNVHTAGLNMMGNPAPFKTRR